MLDRKKRWPKEERHSSSFLKAEIITSKSPSTIKEGRLRSIVRVIARTVASVSTSSDEDGSLIFSTNAVSTFPWESRTTTPSPASSISLNTAPSKLTFRCDGGGGSHLSWDLWGEAVYTGFAGCISVNSCSICVVDGMTWDSEKALLLVRSWLRRDHIVHVINANNSGLLSDFSTNLVSL